jgi:hypothetical protein
LAYLQTSQTEPFGEVVNAVSARLSKTLALNAAALIGGSEATRRWWKVAVRLLNPRVSKFGLLSYYNGGDHLCSVPADLQRLEMQSSMTSM